MLSRRTKAFMALPGSGLFPFVASVALSSPPSLLDLLPIFDIFLRHFFRQETFIDMFFNYDILYCDGPMALVWMAGNEEFASKAIKLGKGRKGKLLVKLLRADLSAMCEIVKKQFPMMGSPNGLGLKKVAILVNGLGNIYLKKVDHLLQCMTEMNLKMQIKEKRSKKGKIDLPQQNARAVNRVNVVDNPLEEVAGNEMWGDLRVDEDSQFFNVEFDFDVPLRMRHPEAPELSANMERVVASPERSVHEDEERARKRRRTTRGDENEDVFNENDVMNKLTTVLQGLSTTANLLRDQDLPQAPIPVTEGDNDFGDIEYMFDVNEDQSRIEAQTVREREELATPGAHGNQNDPIVDDVAMDVDVDVEERRAPVYVRGQEVDMEFQEIDSEQCSPNVRNRNRLRRRPVRLIVDEDITIPSETIQANLRLQKRPNDYDELAEIANETRAAISKHPSWNLKGLNLIKRSGRNTGNQLTELVNENVRKIRVIDPPQPTILVSQPEGDEGVEDVEQVRMAGSTIRDQSSRPGVADGTAFETGSVQPSNIDLGNDNRIDFLQESEELFPTEAFLQDQDVNLGFEGGEDNNQRDVPITLNETVDQMNLNEGETHFKNLFPPVTTSRKQAASAFFQLLRLQKSGKVELKQEHFLGDLIVKKV